MSDLQDKVVLITGGSRGIGRACAVAFAQRHAQVVLTYASNEAAAQETLGLITQAGGRGWSLKLDVSDAQACSQAIDAVMEKHGRIDVLVNNAGVAIDSLVMRMKDDDWDTTLETNLKGAFSLIRAVSRPMMKQRSGAIINLTSVVGEMGNAGQAAYASSKAGLIGLTKSVAKELASRNIRVNAVSPGFIDTEMTSGLPEDVKKKMLEQIPLARLGQAQDVAEAVVFLASEASRYITGEVLKVNGGMYM